MKAVRKIVVLLSAGFLPLVAASASPLEEAYLESCRKDPGVPVPIAVVSPAVGPEYEGGSVQLEFLVKADGKPAEFSIKSATDDVLANPQDPYTVQLIASVPTASTTWLGGETSLGG